MKKESKKKKPGKVKTAGPAAQAPAAAAPIAVIEEEFRLLDLDKVFASSGNYRETFNQASLDELTASVRSKGILQPILVRPLNGNGTYEVVAGSRRRLASIAAGRIQIPAIIRNLSNADALEIQVVENSQREDPNIMEEARGFERLLDIGKHTVETLAAKLDRSTAYVLSRLKLLQLSSHAQKKIAAGQISLGHALLITRLRNESDQKDIITSIIDDDMSVRTVADRIRRLSKKLTDAAFNTETCKTCDFLSRNQTALFPELKKTDECMDRSCWQIKTKEHYRGLIEQRKNEGFKTLIDKKKVEDLINKGSKTVIQIQPSGNAQDNYISTIPKRYKSDCMTCTEHHCFYFYQEEMQRWEGKGKKTIYGELCLNKKCLTEMNNTNKGIARLPNGDESTTRTSESTRKIHAQSCRDRFLCAQLPPLMEGNTALSLRLTAYHLLDKLPATLELREIVKKYAPHFPTYDHMFQSQRYRPIAEASDELLDQFLQDILIAGIQVTDPEVLLQMAPEAGIDMSKDFPVDEMYLKSLTKGELLSYANGADLSLDSITAGSKKGDIIKAIMQHDLRVADTCTFSDRQADESKEEITCLMCDKPAKEDTGFNYEEELCCECSKSECM